MPTGYTSKIYDGKQVTLADFLRTCAPAFILDMRDEPADAPIPERSTYKDDVVASMERNVAAALDTIHELTGLTDAQCSDRATKEHAERVAEVARRNGEKDVLRARYEKVLMETRDWDAPPMLAKIKAFMIEQLESSIEWDCRPSNAPSPPLDGAAWRDENLAHAQRMHRMWSEDLVKQREGQKHNNEWMKTLHAELARLNPA